MTTITQTISALPTAPARSQPAPTFIANADAFVGALGVIGPQMNTMASQMNTVGGEVSANAAAAATQAANAASSAINSAASANAAALATGAAAWVSGTSYTPGQCVFSLIDFQSYRRIIGGAGTVDPKLDATNWVKLGTPAPITSSATVSSGTDVMLTSASAGLQRISMTAAGLAIHLPDATTCHVVGAQFVIRNDGQYQFIVRDSAGLLISVLNPRDSVFVMLSDNSTAAGLWAIGNLSEWDYLQKYYQDASSVIDATAANVFGGMYQISGSSYVAIYGVGSNINGLLLSIVGTSVTVLGSATLVTGGAPGAARAGVAKVAVLSATQFMLVYYNTSTTYANAVIVNISGSTMTPATPIAIAAAASSSSCLCCVPLSSTAAMVFWYQSATTNQNAAIATVSASTISLGAAFTIGTPGDIMATALSATSVLCVFQWSSYPSNNVFVLGVSGTTVSVIGGSLSSTGNFPSPLTNSSGLSGLVWVNSGLAFVLSVSSSATVIFPVVITTGGTTVAIGACVTLTASYGTPAGGAEIVFRSSTQGYILTYGAAGLWITKLTLSGSLLTVGASVNVASVNGGYILYWQQVNDSTTLGFGLAASSYLSTQLFEVVK